MSIDSRERLEFLTYAHGRRGHTLGHSRVGSGTLRVPQTCRTGGQGGIGSVEVGGHQDVEEFGAGCWRHGVELSLQLSLELIATHRSQDRVLLAVDQH